LISHRNSLIDIFNCIAICIWNIRINNRINFRSRTCDLSFGGCFGYNQLSKIQSLNSSNFFNINFSLSKINEVVKSPLTIQNDVLNSTINNIEYNNLDEFTTFSCSSSNSNLITESPWIPSYSFPLSSHLPTVNPAEEPILLTMPRIFKAKIYEDCPDQVFQTFYNSEGKQDSSTALEISIKIIDNELLNFFKSVPNPGHYIYGGLRLFNGAEVTVSTMKKQSFLKQERVFFVFVYIKLFIIFCIFFII